ncbi:MAG: cytochrome d ubiquinol oxidase subunit II [Candidatus Pacebacteria bacterium]|nr:cytochrome d ubiquinol oxidase subunit II [Candidatus Paceibacterota bacterium]
MNEYVAITLVIVPLFLYAVLLMIECGATVFVAVPELLGAGGGGEKMAAVYIAPLWETTNVFLVFAFVSLMAFFPGAVSIWGRALAVPFFVFLAVMGVRAIAMLLVFYRKGAGRFAKALLVCAALASPAVFAAGIVPYFLTAGAPYGGGPLLAFCLGGFALAATFLVSFSFFGYLAARRAVRTTHSMDFLTTFFALVFILVVILLFLMMPVLVPHIAGGAAFHASSSFFAGLSVLELVLLVPSRRDRKDKGRRFALSVALFAAAFFGIAFAQLPYLVYPAVTVMGAFTDPATAHAMFLVFGAGALVTLPSLGILYYLFA